MDITISNLSKRYGSQLAVDNISFEVKTGEVVGFLGPNGAGKSTTMKMITNFINADQGAISLEGKSNLDGSMKKHIGYLPENNPLYLDMAVMDYLAFCAELQGVEKSQIPIRVREMIKVCGLNVEKHKNIGELSKGFRQRVGIAQAMIHDPEVLILDEPTTGLDPNQIVEIRELIRTLGQRKTVILSTHILPEVEATCDRILIINKGKIVADGTATSLRKQTEGQQVLRVKIDHSGIETLEQELLLLPEVAQVESLGEGRFEIQSKPHQSLNSIIFKLCVKKGWVLTEMIPFESKLEDIFRDLTLN